APAAAVGAACRAPIVLTAVAIRRAVPAIVASLGPRRGEGRIVVRVDRDALPDVEPVEPTVVAILIGGHRVAFRVCPRIGLSRDNRDAAGERRAQRQARTKAGSLRGLPSRGELICGQ